MMRLVPGVLPLHDTMGTTLVSQLAAKAVLEQGLAAVRELLLELLFRAWQQSLIPW
jgi:hypothetical protein